MNRMKMLALINTALGHDITLLIIFANCVCRIRSDKI